MKIEEYARISSRNHITETADNLFASLPLDLNIVSGENQEIQTNKHFLSLLSPALSPLLSSPCCASPTLFLPDFSTSSIKNFITIINHGFISSNTILDSDKIEVMETAKVLSVDILELTGEVIFAKDKIYKYNDHDPKVLEGDPKIFQEQIIVGHSELEKADKQIIKGIRKKRPIRQCDKCSYKSDNKRNLENHVSVKHEGVKLVRPKGKLLSCEQCKYKTSHKGTLRRHIEAKHEDGKFNYTCLQCDYKAKRKTGLKYHVEANHEGITYSCNKCEYTVKSKQSLKTHEEYIHQGICYPCDMCDFKARTSFNFKQHINMAHGNNSSA